MERLNEECFVAALDVDVADRAKAHPPAGIEFVEQSLLDPVVGQLLLEGPEDLRVDRFQLEIDLVFDLIRYVTFSVRRPRIGHARIRR